VVENTEPQVLDFFLRALNANLAIVFTLYIAQKHTESVQLQSVYIGVILDGERIKVICIETVPPKILAIIIKKVAAKIYESLNNNVYSCHLSK
jgi:hypothetical protein